VATRRVGATPAWSVDLARDWTDVDYLVLDFETTGTDPLRHEIISAGYLGISHASVHLASCRHRLVRPRGELPSQTVVIHGITHDLAAEGKSAETVIGELLEALAGRVLVGHHVATEVNFLSRACRELFGAPFVGPGAAWPAALPGAQRAARCAGHCRAVPGAGHRSGGA
jgi:DNA polymerase III epsilon subunit-like protein